MKLKKMLASIICVAMVFGTIGITVFAAENVAQIGTVEYATLEDALANVGEGDVVIKLLDDATINVSDAYIKLGKENTTSITIDGNGKRLDLKTTYWSRLNMKKDGAKIVLNNLKLDSSQETGTWNSYDVTFLCPVELNNVKAEKAIAFENDATLKNVTINEINDYYAIWITANGQNVSIDGLTIDSAGRGIKIDEQYIDAPKKVALDVKNATFKTKSKAAILVKSAAGAQITANNVDITNVVADNTNLVWVDEDSADSFGKVEVTGGNLFVEAGEENYSAKVTSGEKVVGYYATLQAAISAAQSGDVITLFDNVTLTNAITVPDGVTIDLNDKTMYLNVENSYFNNSTIKNGEIILGKSSTHVCDGYIHVNDGKTLTIDGVEMTSSEEGMKAYAVFHMYGASQLNLTNVNIDVKDNEYAGSVIYAGNANPVVTIDECTIKGENVGRGSVYGTIIANNSTIEFKGSTETGLEHGFNRSVLTLNNTDVIVSGAYGRGISVGASGNVVITNGSVVDVTDCDEAGIAFKDGTTYTLTVSGEGTTVTTAEIVGDSDTSVIVTDGAVLAQQTALVDDGNTEVTCNNVTVSGTQKSSGAVTSGGIEKKWCAYKFEIVPDGSKINVKVEADGKESQNKTQELANIEAKNVSIGVTVTGVDNLTSIAVTTVE